jgi:hypothetical protein
LLVVLLPARLNVTAFMALRLLHLQNKQRNLGQMAHIAHIAALVDGVEPVDLSRQPFNLGPLHLSCLVQVVLQLHACPQFGAGAESRGKPIGHVSRDARRTGHNAVQCHTVDAKGYSSRSYGRIP